MRLFRNEFSAFIGFRTLAGAVIGISLLATPAKAATDPVGIWLDHTKRGAVEIYSCGAHLCGRVVWMKNHLKSSGEPFRDRRNPKKSQRDRTICGMKMLGRLRASGSKKWSGGWIYDPERGKSFDVVIRARGANQLKVTGYLFSPAFGKTFTWTRAPEDIGRCAPKVEAALN
ncbi:MAG: DUF2147 domain-containing protein [Hyphomicrobiaceae bacterium]